MSGPAQQKLASKRTGKRVSFFTTPSAAMKESAHQPEGSFPVADPGLGTVSTVSSEPEGPHVYLNSVILSPEKGEQSRLTQQTQQSRPARWEQQASGQQQRATGWSAVTAAHWRQSFASYTGGGDASDPRGRTAFVKSGVQTYQQPPDQAAAEPRAGGSYREAAEDVEVEVEWEQQVFQETLKPGALKPRQLGTSHPGGSSVLQPFQLAFGQPKQHLPAFYQSFQGGRTTLPDPPTYPPQSQTQQEREEMQQHHLSQPQGHQMPQQEVHHQQHLLLQQEQQQVQQQLQQQQFQQQQEQMLHQQLEQQNVLDFYCGLPAAQAEPQPAGGLSQEPLPQNQEPVLQDVSLEPQQPPPHSDPQAQSLLQTRPDPPRWLQLAQRRSEEGAPSSDSFPASSAQTSPGRRPPHVGAADPQAAPTGVIQSTRGRHRPTPEVNLETLAQKAAEMEFLPSHGRKEPQRPWSPSEAHALSSRAAADDGLLPLVIPVSVPVWRQEDTTCEQDTAAAPSVWPPSPPDPGRADHQTSVIVTSRRSLKRSVPESSEQNGGTESERDDDKKSKRRPRPEPLFIPPPKAALFIAPPVYSSITPYQSHLRSPVRLLDHPLSVPPYTPPPILSPVREGSGLYFSTLLSATPRSASRGLLSSGGADLTPPVLSAISDVTPVSIEPRINIGARYQADVPELRPKTDVVLDQHRADLLWVPLTGLEGKPDFIQRVEALMHLSCSSVLSGGGTNLELAHHCLHACDGDVMAALSLLLLTTPVFPKAHHLSDYHYSGSDLWSSAERSHFNTGISTHKKDFFMVQKQVVTKTVAQCVEFYYTHKKQASVGRGGLLMYGEAETWGGAQGEMEQQMEETSSRNQGQAERNRDVGLFRVEHKLASSGSMGALLLVKGRDAVRDRPPPGSSKAPPPKPKAGRDGASAGPRDGVKEGEFPCKKCGRIFYKVKSRSAHMKSHAEQEKKAAALRQKEAEQLAAAKASVIMAARRQRERQEEDEEDEEDEDWH